MRDLDERAAEVGVHALPGVDEALDGRLVITSYSIHYTKLYEQFNLMLETKVTAVEARDDGLYSYNFV